LENGDLKESGHSIHWLVQSSIEFPESERAAALEWLLCGSERERLASLKTPKRRHDWLLGRWTSKLLAQAVLVHSNTAAPALNELQVLNAASGAPFLTSKLDGQVLPVALSISHSGDRAFCAAVGILSAGEISGGMLGADIERIEARSPGFVKDYFTETESTLVGRAPARSRDILVTATWSAKEAALKALHLGLTVDTRSATCLIEPVLEDGAPWTPFHIEWDMRRLNNFSQPRGDIPHLVGWWRIMDGFVLTLAAEQGNAPLEFCSYPGETAWKEILKSI
jgi:4'-phosphopantetheinyl transferase